MSVFAGAKVAAIVDRYTIAVNRGRGSGVGIGTALRIGDRPIIDPETGENLGTFEKMRVNVTEVHERFCVAETRFAKPFGPTSVTVNIGDPVYMLREMV